jgi:hypothetical protein
VAITPLSSRGIGETPSPPWNGLAEKKKPPKIKEFHKSVGVIL